MMAGSVVDRFDKLLRLADSPSWHEAEAALRKADALMSGRGVDELDDATYEAQAERLVNAWKALSERPDAPRAEPPPPTHAERTAAEVATMIAKLAEELASIAQARPGSNAEAIIAGVGSLSITVIQQALLALRADPACDPHLGYHSADQMVRTLLEHAMPAFLTLTAREAA